MFDVQRLRPRKSPGGPFRSASHHGARRGRARHPKPAALTISLRRARVRLFLAGMLLADETIQTMPAWLGLIVAHRPEGSTGDGKHRRVVLLGLRRDEDARSIDAIR